MAVKMQLDIMGWGEGEYTVRHQQRRDIMRVKHSMKKASTQYQARANQRRMAKETLKRRAALDEYSAGGDDLPGPSTSK